MAKKGGSQTVTQTVDPQTQAYVNQMRGLALGYAGVPAQGQPAPLRGGIGGVWDRFRAGPNVSPMTPPPLPAEIQNAQNQYGQYAGLGALGVDALSGRNNVFMNSYMDALNPVYNQIRAQSLNAIGDNATMAGAYGGSRQGVAQGVALGQIGQQQALANIDAYNQAQQRAMQAAGLGFGAIGAGAFLPQQYAQGQLNLLNSAIGPYGSTQSQPTTSSPLSGAAGGALVGSQFGPYGALVGGGLGLLGGLFG